LLAAGAAVQSDDDPYRITPLMKAARYGHLAVAQALLAAGADARRRDHVDDTALHGAVVSRNAALAALLLRAGADAKARGKYLDNVPLHHAAEYDSVDITRLLIAAGAALEARDHKGRTALWTAASLDHAATVATLLAAGADPDARDQAGVTPFVAAAAAGGAAARLLLERTRDLDRALAAAVWGRHADLAMRLAGRGADINTVDVLGRPALAGVVVHQGTALLDWFLTQRVDLARRGGAALHAAATTGRSDLARRLLDAGVPVDIRAVDGATALLLAAGGGHVEVVRLLLERGADRGARDAQGRGTDDYMQTDSDRVIASIKKREASRAYHPTGHLKERLKQLADNHAEIRLLLVR